MVKKTPEYNKKIQKYQPILYLLKMSDTKCRIRKNYISHWLCEGIAENFIADAGNTWDPHPLNLDKNTISIIGQQYTMIVDGPRGSVVTMHK